MITILWSSARSKSHKFALFLTAIFLTASVLSQSAWGDNVFIDTQGGFTLYSDPNDDLQLTFNGEITAESLRDFLNISRNREIMVISLNSPGGYVLHGSAIAELINLRGISSEVPEGAECASACSFLFLAGTNRALVGRLGVHQYQNPDGFKDNESEAQENLGRLIELLNSFDTPTIAIEKMAVTKPNCMYWFDAGHADIFARDVGGPEAGSRSRVEGTLECNANADNSPIDLNFKDQTNPSGHELTKLIQVQLNRLGCALGTPDGIIGPRSRASLSQFSRNLEIAYNLDNFENLSFLSYLGTIENRVCFTPPKPLEIDLAGKWSLRAKCSYTTAAIKGWLNLNRKSAGRYSLRYANNQGEKGTGGVVQSGRRATVTVRWSSGARTASNMTINAAGTRMSGQSSNGCVFEAWR